MFTKKRSDGTYIKNMHFFQKLLPYLMPARKDAIIYFETEFDITKTLKFVSAKNRSDTYKISLFYVILYAALRVITVRPRLNRFISGLQYYQRNCIRFNFTAKRNISDDGEEINATMSFSPLLTLEEFCKKIHEHIYQLKKGETTGAEKAHSFFSKPPRFLVKLAAKALLYLDFHNGLPKSVIDSLPFWCTIFFSHLGSVGIDAPFHHLYEVGNCGLFIAIGKNRQEINILEDGSTEKHDKVKITFTYDERITDGIYCARAIDMLKDYVENPEKLETPFKVSQDQLDVLKLAQKELA